MAVQYCHRGGHYVDLDVDSEGAYLKGEWVCWNCLTDEEAEQMQIDEES